MYSIAVYLEAGEHYFRSVSTVALFHFDPSRVLQFSDPRGPRGVEGPVPLHSSPEKSRHSPGFQRNPVCEVVTPGWRAAVAGEAVGTV